MNRLVLLTIRHRKWKCGWLTEFTAAALDGRYAFEYTDFTGKEHMIEWMTKHRIV